MKIAILSHATSPFGLLLARQFVCQGHEVRFLSLSPIPKNCLIEIPAVVLIPRLFTRLNGLKLFRYIAAVIPLRRQLRTWRPDAILSIYITSAGVLSAFVSHPAMILSAIGSDVNEHVDSVIWRIILRFVLGRAKIIHAVSHDLASKISNRIGISSEKIIVSPVGIDTIQLSYTPPQQRPSAPVIICTRRHHPVYDHKTLLKAIKNLELKQFNVSVILIASPGYEKTEHLVKQMELSCVKFLPEYDSRNLPDILSMGNIYVSCSSSDGTSQSLLEAMSVGLFPIVSDIPANTPWIESGVNGYLFPPGDYDALASAIVWATSHQAIVRSACEINREKVSKRADIRLTAQTIISSLSIQN